MRERLSALYLSVFFVNRKGNQVRERRRQRRSGSEEGDEGRGKNLDTLSQPTKKKTAKRRGIIAPRRRSFQLSLLPSFSDLFLSLSLAGRGVKMAAAALPRRIIKETQRFLTDKGAGRMLSRKQKRVFFFSLAAMPFRPPLSHALSPSLHSLSITPSVPGIKAEPDEQNLRYFKVEIDGPANTPYEGAFFLVFCDHRDGDDGGKKERKKNDCSTSFSFPLSFLRNYKHNNNQVASSSSSYSCPRTTRWRHQR